MGVQSISPLGFETMVERVQDCGWGFFPIYSGGDGVWVDERSRDVT
jgi:hypothetical protein